MTFAQKGSATKLAHPKKNAEISLSVDASDIAVGAGVHQRVGSATEPLGFYSKKFTETQKRYSNSTYDRELEAIFQGVKHFIHLLEGHEFCIWTDQIPLTFAMSKKKLLSKPRRMLY